MFDGAAQELQLLLNEEAGHGGQVMGHALGGGMSAVGRAEGVVDIDVAVAGKLLGEIRIILFLFVMEAEVFKQADFAFLQGGNDAVRVFADDILGHLDGAAQQLAQAQGGRSQGVLHVELALGAAQVAHQHDFGVLVHQVFDGGQRAHNAVIVGDLAFLVLRYVEVNADDDTLAL